MKQSPNTLTMRPPPRDAIHTLCPCCRTYPALENLVEPHRLISCLHCTVSGARSMLSNHQTYPEGRLHVIPLLCLSLPGIDSNDCKKCLVGYDGAMWGVRQGGPICMFLGQICMSILCYFIKTRFVVAQLIHFDSHRRFNHRQWPSSGTYLPCLPDEDH